MNLAPHCSHQMHLSSGSKGWHLEHELGWLPVLTFCCCPAERRKALQNLIESPGSRNVSIRQLEQSAIKVRPHLAMVVGCLHSQWWWHGKHQYPMA